jgi:hypothetical protein
MKRPFRFFRGEFNGFYLYRLVTCLNFTVQDIVDELVYQALFQWKLEDEITTGELAIRDEDIINVGKTAGLFQPRTYGRSSLGSTYFTPGHIVNGKERSERGLMDMYYESFRFVREEQDEYDDDIVNEASEKQRMGFIPDGTEPIGYVPMGVQLYTDEGDVIWENILTEPPADGTPYTPFYGEKFLVHEELFNKESPLTIDVYKLLLECVMRIRHDGPSIKGLLEVTEILGDGYIYDLEIVPSGRYYTVYYRLSDEAVVQNRDRRFAAWQTVCKQKFKHYVFIPHV